MNRTSGYENSDNCHVKDQLLDRSGLGSSDRDDERDGDKGHHQKYR